MRSALFAAPLFAGVALSACAPIQVPAVQESAAQAMTIYRCADGTTFSAFYPTTDTARLMIGDQTVDLRIAEAASGARYIGGGWQWWTRGRSEGLLARLAPGEEMASAAGTSCTA